MGRGVIRIALLLIFASAHSSAQTNPMSVELFGAFTTTSKYFPYAEDPSEVRRSFFLSLDGIVHAGIEVRAAVSSFSLQVGLGSEYIQHTESFDVPVASSTVPVRDGFRAIPVELTGYFYLPIGNERIRTYLGGGIGLYSGERIYEYASVRSNVTDKAGGFGIHVLFGLEYFVFERWSVRGEFKVRDIQFESVNEFSEPTTVYNGETIPLPADAMHARYNIDGMMFRTGISYSF